MKAIEQHKSGWVSSLYNCNCSQSSRVKGKSVLLLRIDKDEGIFSHHEMFEIAHCMKCYVHEEKLHFFINCQNPNFARLKDALCTWTFA